MYLLRSIQYSFLKDRPHLRVSLDEHSGIKLSGPITGPTGENVGIFETPNVKQFLIISSFHSFKPTLKFDQKLHSYVLWSYHDNHKGREIYFFHCVVTLTTFQLHCLGARTQVKSLLLTCISLLPNRRPFPVWCSFPTTPCYF